MQYEHKHKKYKMKYLACNEPLEGYWIGPYSVRIPNNINIVTATDGYNMRFKDGGETGMCMVKPPVMNADIYRKKYAKLKSDGCYYYKKK